MMACYLSRHIAVIYIGKMGCKCHICTFKFLNMTEFHDNINNGNKLFPWEKQFVSPMETVSSLRWNYGELAVLMTLQIRPDLASNLPK